MTPLKLDTIIDNCKTNGKSRRERVISAKEYKALCSMTTYHDSSKKMNDIHTYTTWHRRIPTQECILKLFILTSLRINLNVADQEGRTTLDLIFDFRSFWRVRAPLNDKIIPSPTQDLTFHNEK